MQPLSSPPERGQLAAGHSRTIARTHALFALVCSFRQLASLPSPQTKEAGLDSPSSRREASQNISECVYSQNESDVQRWMGQPEAAKR